MYASFVVFVCLMCLCGLFLVYRVKLYGLLLCLYVGVCCYVFVCSLCDVLCDVVGIVLCVFVFMCFI